MVHVNIRLTKKKKHRNKNTTRRITKEELTPELIFFCGLEPAILCFFTLTSSQSISSSEKEEKKKEKKERTKKQKKGKGRTPKEKDKEDKGRKRKKEKAQKQEQRGAQREGDKETNYQKRIDSRVNPFFRLLMLL